MSTYQQLQALVVAQGIAGKEALHPNADLVTDLTYKIGDIAELARLAERTFQVRIDVEDYSAFTTLRSVVHLLNNKQIKRDLTRPFSGYSSRA